MTADPKTPVEELEGEELEAEYRRMDEAIPGPTVFGLIPVDRARFNTPLIGQVGISLTKSREERLRDAKRSAIRIARDMGYDASTGQATTKKEP